MNPNKTLGYEDAFVGIENQLLEASAALLDRWTRKPPFHEYRYYDDHWCREMLEFVGGSKILTTREKFLYVAEGLVRNAKGKWMLFPQLRNDSSVYVNMLIWCPNIDNVVNVSVVADYLETEPILTYIERVLSGEDLTKLTFSEIINL